MRMKIFHTNFSNLPRGSSLKKILVHPPKNPKKKSKKSKDFFEDLKFVYLISERTTPRIQCLTHFLFIKSSYTKKKPEKIGKKSNKPKDCSGRKYVNM